MRKPREPAQTLAAHTHRRPPSQCARASFVIMSSVALWQRYGTPNLMITTAPGPRLLASAHRERWANGAAASFALLRRRGRQRETTQAGSPPARRAQI